MNKDILLKNFSQAKLEKVEDSTTSKAGLVYFFQAMKHYGANKILDSNFPKGNSNAEYVGHKKIMPFMMTLVGGGNRVEDIEVLRADKALFKSCGIDRVVGADAIRDFLKPKKHGVYLRRSIDALSKKVMQESKCKELTYDNDWTFIPSDKKSAAYSYKKEKGFGSLLGFIPELDLGITYDFKPGNVSPASGIAKHIQKADRLAKEAGKRITKVRLDSAGHSKEVINLCEKLKLKWYITMKKNKLLQETVAGIVEKDWQELDKKKKRQYTEALYPMAGLKPDRAVRIIVIRWENPDPTLFEQNPYCYHVVGTNDYELSGSEVVELHNGRMGSENYNKEFKSGFGADYCPSQSIVANRNFFLLVLLAYNLFQIFKYFYFEKEYRPWSIRTFRFWFASTCGKLIFHANQFTYRLINVTDKMFLLFKFIHQKLCCT